MKKLLAQSDTIAEGIANLEHHERDPGEQMPPIINDDNTPAEAELVADEIEINDPESYGTNRNGRECESWNRQQA